jgi:Flp pilus assembly protein TadD
MHPDVRARRAKYAPVVKWVILAAVVVGLLGLWKHRSTQGDQEQAAREMEEYKLTHPPGSRTNNPAPVDPSAQAAAQPPAAAAAPASAAPAQSAPAAEPAAADNAQPNAVKTAASAESKPGDTPVVAAAATASASASAGASAAPPEAPLAPAKTAAQEKRDCQVFLDRGAFPRAIEAGQRSVALDPSDGEAWLLLGAAYQATGRKGDAKRSFSACISQGKRGPIGDCKSMLQ